MLRQGHWASNRALARARSRMGARAHVGLPPGGREAGRAWRQGDLPADVGVVSGRAAMQQSLHLLELQATPYE